MRSLALLLLLATVDLSSSISVKCLLCKGAVEVLKFTYERKSTREEIIKGAVYLCRRFADKDSLICEGIISQFQPSFLYVFEQLLFQPSQLCGLILNNCGTPSANPFDTNWTVSLPPLPSASNGDGANSDGGNAKPFKVLQLSDIHFDFSYTPGSDVQCGSPVCCNTKKANNGGAKAGYWGSLGPCDIPFWTVENMLQHINQSHQLDYIMLTGDYMSHVDWNYTKEDHLYIIANLTSLMKKYFPKTPTFWAIGNHEGVPVNSFAPHFAPLEFRPQWLYDAVYEADREWLPEQTRKPMNYRGSYSLMLTKDLKLITLNTGYCDVTNFFLYINQTDPDQLLSWLVDELYRSELANQFVHIMAHIPPGNGECLEGWARNYYRIVNRFSKVITAQFFGHVHTDGFTVFYEDMNDYRSKPTSVLFVSPSVTTFENVNPAYRIYTIDGAHNSSRYEVLDFENHFLNLSRIATSQDQPRWEPLYKAKEEYGLEDLSAQSWHSLSERIRTNRTLYNRFLRNYARRDDYDCDRSCRKELLCSLRRAHHNESALCPGNSFIRKKLVPVVLRREVPTLEASVQEPLTRDDFLFNAAKKTIWSRISGWISKKRDD